MRKIVIDCTNLEGLRIFGVSWNIIDDVTMKAYIGILILVGVYRCHGESIDNLWDDKVGRPIFRAIMFKESFQKLSRVIRFDDKVTLQHRRANETFGKVDRQLLYYKIPLKI